jgi:hypothetical protein
MNAFERRLAADPRGVEGERPASVVGTMRGGDRGATGRRIVAASIVVIATSVVLGGCRSLPDYSELDDAAKRELVREQANSVKSLSASVSMGIETGKFEGSLSGALLVEPPARLRLRTSKMMQDVFDLVVTPELLELYWFRDRSFFRRRLAPGATSPAGAKPKLDGRSTLDGKPKAGGEEEEPGPESFLARLDGRSMRLALTGFELPRVGEESPIPAGDRVVEESFSRVGGEFVVRARLAGGDRLVRRFDGKSLFLRKLTLDGPDGATKLRVSYDDYAPIEIPAPAGGTPRAIWLARETRLEDLVMEATFEMDLDDVVLDEEILPGAFQLVPPPGVEVRDL